MDEVVTCRCGNQAWVIGTEGIRCNKCELALPLRFTFPVQDANQSLKSENAYEERKRIERPTPPEAPEGPPIELIREGDVRRYETISLPVGTFSPYQLRVGSKFIITDGEIRLRVKIQTKTNVE